MSTRHSPAFSFWLDYLESRGGLWERSGDTVLAVLPEPLVATHNLPESALITDDPDISREDGVLFLGAGHPEIGRAAESVIDTGDVGALTLPHRSRLPPSTQDLQAMIRELIAVDHGRIDATGAPIRTHRPTVRLSVLVTHTVSAEEHFTEVADCMVDVASRIAWPEESARRLRHAVTTAEAAPRRDVRTGPLVPALAAAYEVLNETAAARGRILAADADAERTAELDRAREYYAAALAAIDKRRGGADPQRATLLDARAEATTAERDRRTAEIKDKYRHGHSLRPYRLQLIDVPVWRLATDVRRGDRRWPVTFDYLPLTGALAPTRCPACDAPAPLVATKTHLGCATCVPPAKTPNPAPPAAPKPPARPDPPSATPTKPATAPKRREPVHATKTKPTTVRAAGPVLPRKAEEKKAADFWHLVGAGERRKLVRLIAPDSPLAALTRLYGASGPLYGIGVPAGHTPVEFTCGNLDKAVARQRGGTGGVLRTHDDEYRYLLVWSPDRLLEEILPYATPWALGLAGRFLGGSIIPAPPTRVDLDLDLVAKLLFARTAPRHGLTFTARALAAWWRLPSPDDLLSRFPPRVLAAAVDRAVRYWSGAGQATYPEAAEAFGADVAAVRKVTPVLQKCLRFSGTTNW